MIGKLRIWVSETVNIALKIPYIFYGIVLGTGLNDLARFIALSTNADIQEEHTEYLLRVYYDVFKSELENNGHEIDYDFEKVSKI